jgi:hypothetical protein
MSWLCDTTELVPSGWLSSRYAGHGVLAEDIPSTGLDGPSALYGAVTLPADNGKEIRGYITRWPAATLDIDEDGTFTYSGGPDYFEFLLAVDGVDSTANIGFGAGISRIWLGTDGVTVYRPASDIVVNSWTPSTGSDLFAMIDETVLNRADFITSPNLTNPVTMGWGSSLAAGTYDVSVDFDRTGTQGQLRIVLLDSGGTAVGTSSWQAAPSSAATTVFSVTTTGTSDRFRIEVQA